VCEGVLWRLSVPATTRPVKLARSAAHRWHGAERWWRTTAVPWRCARCGTLRATCHPDPGRPTNPAPYLRRERCADANPPRIEAGLRSWSVHKSRAFYQPPPRAVTPAMQTHLSPESRTPLTAERRPSSASACIGGFARKPVRRIMAGDERDGPARTNLLMKQVLEGRKLPAARSNIWIAA